MSAGGAPQRRQHRKNRQPCRGDGAAPARVSAHTDLALEKALLGEGKGPAAADNDMVQHADVEEAEAGLETLGDTPVGMTGLGHPRGVVVGKDDRCGPVLQGAHGYLPGIDGGAVEGAQEQVLAAQEPVLAVEEQTGEDLAAAGAQVVLQEALRVSRAAHHVDPAQLLLDAAPRQFQGGLEMGDLGATHTRLGLERNSIHGQHAGEIAGALEEGAGQPDRRAATTTRAQYHGQQLGIGENAGAVQAQFFPRALAPGPVVYRHGAAPPWAVANGVRRGCLCYLPAFHTPDVPRPGPAMAHLFNRNVVLGVCGGIAAYKAAGLVRELQTRGADVRVIMTRGAEAFLTPLTLQALSTHPVHRDLLDEEAERGMGHIELARWADLLLIAPATADCLARLAAGRADDLLTTVALATAAPVLVAPAMNHQMWADRATIANMATLEQRGTHRIGPDAGDQACGEVGPGRMSEPPAIAEKAAALFETGALAGLRVVITAGPTREPLDPVRYLSNRSSGKMGFALAAACADAGARTTLVSGPVTLATPPRVARRDVESTGEMLEASLALLPDCDIFIACAAVADYRPERAATDKIKSEEDRLTLTLVRNPDIVATVAASEPRPFTVGFAAETRDLLAYARGKLERKGLDLVVANDVSAAGIGFNSDDNAVTILGPDGEETLPRAGKGSVARALVARIAAQHAAARGRAVVPPGSAP